MYYQNRECGNLLTYPEMLKEWAELYDGGDPTNPCGWMEYYICIGSLNIEGAFLCAARRRLPAARGERCSAKCTVSAIL